jgi:Ca2+-binding EF-hand superfamily protein
LDEVARNIDEKRAQNYKRDQFNNMFEEFDEDENGFLSKAEMATLIK